MRGRSSQCQSVASEKTKKVCLEIEAAYERLDTAMVKKDLEAIRSILAPDYAQLESSGEEVGLTERMKTLQDLLASMRDLKIERVIESIDADGDDFTILAQSKLTFINAFSNDKGRIETAQRDRWTHRGGAWRMRYSEAKSLKFWLNDKLIAGKRRRHSTDHGGSARPSFAIWPIFPIRSIRSSVAMALTISPSWIR